MAIPVPVYDSLYLGLECSRNQVSTKLLDRTKAVRPILRLNEGRLERCRFVSNADSNGSAAGAAAPASFDQPEIKPVISSDVATGHATPIEDGSEYSSNVYHCNLVWSGLESYAPPEFKLSTLNADTGTGAGADRVLHVMLLRFVDGKLYWDKLTPFQPPVSTTSGSGDASGDASGAIASSIAVPGSIERVIAPLSAQYQWVITPITGMDVSSHVTIEFEPESLAVREITVADIPDATEPELELFASRSAENAAIVKALGHVQEKRFDTKLNDLKLMETGAIGAGAFGRVFEATWKGMRVAVKRVNPHPPAPSLTDTKTRHIKSEMSKSKSKPAPPLDRPGSTPVIPKAAPKPGAAPGASNFALDAPAVRPAQAEQNDSKDVKSKSKSVEPTLVRTNAFQRELNILKSVNHLNVIRLFGAAVREDESGNKYLLIVMEHGGMSVADQIDQSEVPFASTTTYRHAAQIAAGMQHLHTLGFTHGDLTANNILVRVYIS